MIISICRFLRQPQNFINFEWMKNKLHFYQSKPEDVPHNFWFYDKTKGFGKTITQTSVPFGVEPNSGENHYKPNLFGSVGVTKRLKLSKKFHPFSNKTKAAESCLWNATVNSYYLFWLVYPSPNFIERWLLRFYLWIPFRGAINSHLFNPICKNDNFVALN